MTGPILIRGGGEMASGVAYMLHCAGYRVVIAEVETPRAIRRSVSFAEAVYSGECRVEHIAGKLVADSKVETCWAEQIVPVVIDPEASIRETRNFPVMVDALMSKGNAGETSSDWAPLVVGLGPGLTAPRDCHVVVETMRGHYLGRFYDRGAAIPNTGEPGEIGGETSARVVRAPVEGTVEPAVEIGQMLDSGAVVARIGSETARAGVSGVVRGVAAAGCKVKAGEKIADIDPRGNRAYCWLVSEKARLIGAGVRGAIEWWFSGRPYPAAAPPDGR